jgi:hypothetical protein
LYPISFSNTHATSASNWPGESNQAGVLGMGCSAGAGGGSWKGMRGWDMVAVSLWAAAFFDCLARHVRQAPLPNLIVCAAKTYPSGVLLVDALRRRRGWGLVM